MPIYSTSFSSPLGELTAVADEDTLLLLEFGDSKELQKKQEVIEKGYAVTCIE